jgi:hypothetical protein
MKVTKSVPTKAIKAIKAVKPAKPLKSAKAAPVKASKASKATEAPAKKKRVFSAAGRAAIIAGAQKRWALYRAAKAKAARLAKKGKK